MLVKSEVRIDWAHISGNAAAVVSFVPWAVERWGNFERSYGRFGYRGSLRFENGAILLVQPADGADRATLCLPGGFFGELRGVEQVDVLVSLYVMGFTKFTRLDVAADLRGDFGHVISAVAEAADSGMMAGLRRHQRFAIKQGRSTVGDGVGLGSRGNADGRYVRFYDKGLETGQGAIGSWVRWEVEFHGAAAQAAWVAVLGAFKRSHKQFGDQDFYRAYDQVLGEGAATAKDEVACLRALVAGSVDFVCRNGASRSLERASRLPFFAELVGAVEAISAIASRVACSSWSRVKGWLASQVIPTIRELANASGLSWDDVLSIAAEGMPQKRCRGNLAIRQFVAILDERASVFPSLPLVT